MRFFSYPLIASSLLIAGGLTNSASANSYVDDLEALNCDNLTSIITYHANMTSGGATLCEFYQSLSIIKNDEIITTNTSSITSNSSSITSNTSNITSNSSSITSNSSSITSNTSSLSTNTSKISDNTSNITSNTSDISNHTSSLSTNTSNISGNTSNISGNTSSINSNSSSISSNTSDITSNTSNISSNTSDISSNTSNISSNTSNISSNTSNISSNQSAINTNISNINTNTLNINTNTSNINTNTSNINTNKNNINNLGQGVAGATALSGALNALPQIGSNDSNASCGLGSASYSGRIGLGFGCAKKINQRIDVNAGGSFVFGGSHDYGDGTLDNSMVKAGVVFKLGKLNNQTMINDKITNGCSIDVCERINALEGQNKELLEKQNDLLDSQATLLARLATLEKSIAKK